MKGSRPGARTTRGK